MRELSLFTGAGGGILGSKLLGWETIGYVEREEYCQKIIKQRIADAILDAAPIFGDIRKFISEGYAKSYQGLVDVITAGFPCQPFSVAGKGLGVDDPRNMWPATIECIRIIRPRYAFLENVPGLLVHDYIKQIFGDLAESGYDCQWRCLSASEVGANHKRDRLWICVSRKSEGDRSNKIGEVQEGKTPKSRGVCEDVADSMCIRNQTESKPTNTRNKGNSDGVVTSSQAMAHPDSPRKLSKQGWNDRSSHSDQNVAHPEKIHAQGRDNRQGQRESRGGSWWSIEPNVGRMAYGVASRVDRLKALGNGQVPQVARTAWELLTEKKG